MGESNGRFLKSATAVLVVLGLSLAVLDVKQYQTTMALSSQLAAITKQARTEAAKRSSPLLTREGR